MDAQDLCEQVWAVVRKVDPKGRVEYGVERVPSSSPERTESADGSRKAILKRFDKEDDAREHLKRYVKDRKRPVKGEEQEKAEGEPKEPAASEPERGRDARAGKRPGS